MKTERNKFLAEAMGWEQVTSAIQPTDQIWFHDPSHPNPTVRFPVNFSTWDGFGKLKAFMDTHPKRIEFYDDYLDKITPRDCSVADTFCRIDPDSFADFTYEFLGEQS